MACSNKQKRPPPPQKKRPAVKPHPHNIISICRPIHGSIRSCSNNTTSGQFVFSLDPSKLASDLLTNGYGSDSALYPVNISDLLRNALLMELPGRYYVGLSGTWYGSVRGRTE